MASDDNGSMGRNPRNQLLPVWIRICSWFFLVLGVAFLVGAVFVAPFRHGPVNIILFGFEHRGSSWDLESAAMVAVSIFFGYAAFALLWGWRSGRLLGLAAGYLGLAIVCSAFVLGLSHGNLSIRLEPLLQVPFIVSLHRLKSRWDAFEPAA